MIVNDVLVYFVFIFLLLATLNDFYNKKVSNMLIIVGGMSLLLLLFMFQSLDKLQALVYVLPVVLILHKMRAIGGGDCKVLLVMSPVLSFESLCFILLISSGAFLIVNGIKVCIKKCRGVQLPIVWLKSQEKFTYTLLFAYCVINIRS